MYERYQMYYLPATRSIITFCSHVVTSINWKRLSIYWVFNFDLFQVNYNCTKGKKYVCIFEVVGSGFTCTQLEKVKLMYDIPLQCVVIWDAMLIAL